MPLTLADRIDKDSAVFKTVFRDGTYVAQSGVV